MNRFDKFFKNSTALWCGMLVGYILGIGAHWAIHPEDITRDYLISSVVVTCIDAGLIWVSMTVLTIIGAFIDWVDDIKSARKEDDED